MLKLLVVIGLAALTSGSPLSRLDGKIVGGDDIDIADVPYQVSLFRYGRFSCGGSIISEDYVLTAAHCSQGNSYTIRAGSSYVNKNGSIHSVSNVIVHENFGISSSNLIQNDIALMKVDPPFVLDDTRQAISLVRKGTFLSAGLEALVSGWGRLSEGGQSPPQLQAVKVPLISKESCQDQYSNFGTIPEGQICAAYPEGGKDACQGDSGGPLAVGGLLAGVVSWGQGCARPLKPGVYTEVAHYREWISQHTGL